MVRQSLLLVLEAISWLKRDVSRAFRSLAAGRHFLGQNRAWLTDVSDTHLQTQGRHPCRLAHKSGSKFFSRAKREQEIFLCFLLQRLAGERELTGYEKRRTLRKSIIPVKQYFFKFLSCIVISFYMKYKKVEYCNK